MKKLCNMMLTLMLCVSVSGTVTYAEDVVPTSETGSSVSATSTPTSDVETSLPDESSVTSNDLSSDLTQTEEESDDEVTDDLAESESKQADVIEQNSGDSNTDQISSDDDDQSQNSESSETNETLSEVQDADKNSAAMASISTFSVEQSNENSMVEPYASYQVYTVENLSDLKEAARYASVGDRVELSANVDIDLGGAVSFVNAVDIIGNGASVHGAIIFSNFNDDVTVSGLNFSTQSNNSNHALTISNNTDAHTLTVDNCSFDGYEYAINVSSNSKNVATVVTNTTFGSHVGTAVVTKIGKDINNTVTFGDGNTINAVFALQQFGNTEGNSGYNVNSYYYDTDPATSESVNALETPVRFVLGVESAEANGKELISEATKANGVVYIMSGEYDITVTPDDGRGKYGSGLILDKSVSLVGVGETQPLIYGFSNEFNDGTDNGKNGQSTIYVTGANVSLDNLSIMPLGGIGVDANNWQKTVGVTSTASGFEMTNCKTLPNTKQKDDQSTSMSTSSGWIHVSTDDAVIEKNVFGTGTTVAAGWIGTTVEEGYHKVNASSNYWGEGMTSEDIASQLDGPVIVDDYYASSDFSEESVTNYGPNLSAIDKLVVANSGWVTVENPDKSADTTVADDMNLVSLSDSVDGGFYTGSTYAQALSENVLAVRMPIYLDFESYEYGDLFSVEAVIKNAENNYSNEWRVTGQFDGSSFTFSIDGASEAGTVSVADSGVYQIQWSMARWNNQTTGQVSILDKDGNVVGTFAKQQIETQTGSGYTGEPVNFGFLWAFGREYDGGHRYFVTPLLVFVSDVAKPITDTSNSFGNKVTNSVTTWDDGGPFTTDACGSVYDRWGNLIYQGTCSLTGGTIGFQLVNTSDR